MGLRSDIQTDIAAAFNTDLADAVQTFTLHSIVTGAFNPDDGTVGKMVNDYPSRGVFDGLNESQIADENVKPTDSQLIILQNEIGIAPKVDDELTYDGERYVVLSVAEDPALATWTLVIRHG